jgi:hypothetical protein
MYLSKRKLLPAISNSEFLLFTLILIFYLSPVYTLVITQM